MIETAGSLIGKLKILEEKISWVNCPFCDLEWTKLRSCSYWDGYEKKESYVCVDCAENPEGLQYMAMLYKIPGSEVSIEKYRPRHNQARIAYASQEFMVRSKSMGLTAHEGKKEDQAKYYDNTYQVWFMLKHEFNQPKIKQEISWGD